MSDPVTMMVTQAGLAAFLAADAAHPIVITQVGLTQNAFIVAPTIDALPGEFKRLTASFSGDVVSETIIHMTAVDGTADIYDLRGLALYLDDGTLFAVYAQPTPIFTKVSIASFLLALDVAFANGTGNISFGDAIFLLPPATETRAGMARIATNAEADGGTDDQTIISPLKLQRRLTALANAFGIDLDALAQSIGLDITALEQALDALQGRTITGTGLATGGGDLTQSRTLDVPAASGAEAIAGTATDKALTPAALRAVQAALSIGVSGLATGGGDLTEGRTITVPAATGAEAIAGTVTDKALTPGALRAVQAALSIGVSGLATGGGDLTEGRTIGVPAATGGETIAGTATDRAITPAALFAFRSAITFSGGGLVKGGGNLALSRTLTVDAASSADVAAGSATDKAITPAALSGLARSLGQNGYAYLPGTGGLILQWGRFSAPANTTTNTLFPIAFPTECFAVTPCGGAAGGADSQDNPPVLVTSGITRSGFAVFSADDTTAGMAYLAIGI